MYGSPTAPTNLPNSGVGVHHRCQEYGIIMVMMDAVCSFSLKKAQLAMTAVKFEERWKEQGADDEEWKLLTV